MKNKREKIFKIIFTVCMIVQILIFAYSIYIGASDRVFDKTKLATDEPTRLFFRNYIIVIRLQIIAMLLTLSALFLKFYKKVFSSVIVFIVTMFILIDAFAIPITTNVIEKNDVEPKEIFYDNKNIFECLD